MSISKKRSADEMDHEIMMDKDNVMEIINRLQQDFKKLQDDHKALKEEFEAFKATSKDSSPTARQVENEESDDDADEDDADSVCDGSPWSQKYFLLKQYGQEHGDCKVPRSHKALGIWVNNMRSNRRKNQIPQDRIAKLDKIGFHWGKGYPEPVTWDDRYGELKTYHTKFGHCNIHVDANPARQSDLAKWVLEQRKQGKRLRRMKPSSMTMEQYDRLDDLGFKWKVSKKAARCS